MKINNNINLDKKNLTKQSLLDDGYKLIWPNQDNIKISIRSMAVDFVSVKSFRVIERFHFKRESSQKRQNKKSLIFIPHNYDTDNKFLIKLRLKNTIKKFDICVCFVENNTRTCIFPKYKKVIEEIYMNQQNSTVYLYIDDSYKNKKELRRSKKELQKNENITKIDTLLN